MSARLERTRNHDDISTVVSIAINAITATTIFPAREDRIKVTIMNATDHGVWIREKAASVDNNKDGYFLPRYSAINDIPDNTYTGEISAIAETGTPTIEGVEV